MMFSDRSTPEQTADFVISLYEKFGGDDYIGEPVSQIEHMCQSAVLAESEGYDTEIILAAFFHDIGHLCEHIMEVKQMDGYGVVDHEKLGADFLLEKGFSENIASLVRNHVQAKRYLTFSNEEYYNRLSEASRKTLAFQGGRMTAEEASAFEADPLFDMHIRLRQWDEKAKLEHQPLPPLSKYRNMMVDHLSAD
ncbi:HD domain-containing protein [Terrimonas sp. NA20]|uniref:HD domain-containing protein n=1 Tax=Terrimonas ginsenosidimutans TaxID=2908004 RepID=A0ABS9KP01_9BACT|nr:HD domain-containing protein [Terrimonas ginsenosidimutans]MCG2614024.1 HD domain-containing protein [Terrimonas ginsenosidimutans]